jgi:UDP-glucuronate 4-epimerase
MDTFCILGDCNKLHCHHCFPIKECSKHNICSKNGCCDEIIPEKKILVTGCAGFIGSHVCEYLCKHNYHVLGIDNINDYYDISLKYRNIALLQTYPNFTFLKEDIRDTNVIQQFCPFKIIHLASMAGVRYSIEHPQLYFDVNVNGFIHLLQEATKVNVKSIIYASSSSVYGLNKKVPFHEDDPIQTCNSPYACSKMSMELLAKTYHQLYKINCIGLRFFTVFGPRGRPDMAPDKFLRAIHHEKYFKKYGDGSSSRDYTFVEDIVGGIVGALESDIKIGVYNLGNSKPCSLNEFIQTCEKVTNKRAMYEEIENQLGDVPHTYASITNAEQDLGYAPQTSLEDGLRKTYEYIKKM